MVAVLIAGGALVGIHRVNNDCESSGSRNIAAFCQFYDPHHSASNASSAVAATDPADSRGTSQN